MERKITYNWGVCKLITKQIYYNVIIKIKFNVVVLNIIIYNRYIHILDMVDGLESEGMYFSIWYEYGLAEVTKTSGN